MGVILDSEGNHNSMKYSLKVQVLRVLWGAVYPLYRFSPRICFGWRNIILRLFGAQIGPNVYIYNTATIYMPWNLKIAQWSAIGEHAYIYNIGEVIIGRSVTISQRVHLCTGTHDYTNPKSPLLKKKIVIEDQAWVCADAFIGPGITVGEGAVTGARSVVVRDVPAWTVVAGNPAKYIKRRELKAEGN